MHSTANGVTDAASENTRKLQFTVYFGQGQLASGSGAFGGHRRPTIAAVIALQVGAADRRFTSVRVTRGGGVSLCAMHWNPLQQAVPLS